jgi:hypothetical protein
MSNHEPRTQYGMIRTTCACTVCVNNCRHMPGYLVPDDLDRLLPDDRDWHGKLLWASQHLRASEGARAVKDGQEIRIPTIVPAHRADLSCHWLGDDSRCKVHADSPFGCAFFDCRDTVDRDNGREGLIDVYKTWYEADSENIGRLRYAQVWIYLHSAGLIAPPLQVRKDAARRALGIA